MTLWQVETMKDVKKFLQQYVERKTVVGKCVRKGRSSPFDMDILRGNSIFVIQNI